MVGDSHGNQAHIHAVIAVAKENNYDCIIHVGNFGFWPVFPDNMFVTLTHKLAVQNGLPFIVIDGNHDYPGTSSEDNNGFTSWWYTEQTLWEPGLKWLPRGTLLNIDRKRTMFLGGGISVDLEYRKKGTSWWSTEAISDTDVEICHEKGQVDILISHDRVGIPPGLPILNFGSKVSAMLTQQYKMMVNIFEVAQPALHIHGHFHMKYDVTDEEWPGCRTVGLDAENFDSICGLDFETMEVTWPVHDKVDNRVVV